MIYQSHELVIFIQYCCRAAL